MVKYFTNQEIINAGDLDLQHISCPDCGNDTNIRLTGLACVPRQETITKDGNVEIETDNTDIGFDIKRLDCLGCEKSFIIWDKSLYESQQTVNFLGTYIKEKLGEDILKKGLVN